MIPTFVDTSSGELKISNRMCPNKNEAFQAIVLLLRVDSPFAEQATSLEGLVGYSDTDDATGDILLRIKNIETVLQDEYDVDRLMVESIDLTDENRYEIVLILKYNDGTAVKETIYA